MTACQAEFWQCECSLDEHPDFIPHHCTNDGCGGLWLDNPDDPLTALVVRYPVRAALDAGVAQPSEPIPEPRDDGADRGAIKVFPAPSLGLGL